MANIEKKYLFPILVAVLLLCFPSCTSVREAQEIIATADSLAHSVTSVELYIVTHTDSTKEVEPFQPHPQATKLLELDLTCRYDLTWLWVFFATLCIVGVPFSFYVHKKNAPYYRAAQRTINQQNEETPAPHTRRLKIAPSEYEEQVLRNMRQLQQSVEKQCRLLRRTKRLHELNWTDYSKMCESVNARFNLLISKLETYECLSERETRLCVLVMIGFNRFRISELLNYSYSGVGKLKDTTAKKLGTTGRKLHDFLLQLVLEM